MSYSARYGLEGSLCKTTARLENREGQIHNRDACSDYDIISLGHYRTQEGSLGQTTVGTVGQKSSLGQTHNRDVPLVRVGGVLDGNAVVARVDVRARPRQHLRRGYGRYGGSD